MERALARIRALLADGGVAFVAVCDPHAVHVEHTAG
jgi:predicted dehydrogenase